GGDGGARLRPGGIDAYTPARLDPAGPARAGRGGRPRRGRRPVALASAERLTDSYSVTGEPALRNLSLSLGPGRPPGRRASSGCGKSTLLRAFAGLVPHFHGGCFSGRVDVAGRDTRRHRPAELAGVVATLFQDPEDQVVFAHVGAEVAFGLENVGTPPHEIE